MAAAAAEEEELNSPQLEGLQSPVLKVLRWAQPALGSQTCRKPSSDSALRSGGADGGGGCAELKR